VEISSSVTQHGDIILPSKNKRSSKSPGIVIISKGAPSISTGKAGETRSYDRGAWASRAKSDDLLFILDHAPFGVIVNKGETGEVVYQNPALIRISGYPASEAGDVESALRALTPDHVDMRAKMEKLRQLEEAGGGIFLDEIKTKDGVTKIIEMRTIVLPDKTRVGLFIDVTRREEAEKALREVNIELENRVEKRTAELKEINKQLRREIKERRKAEKELEHSGEELRYLSEHLQRAREEERLSIAREVHDELGQLLSVMKIDASFLGQNVPKRLSHLKKQTESFEKQINEAIQSVRDICSRLRPSVLTHFGLSAAIEWYLEDLRKRTSINSISQIDVDVPVEETELSLVLFRILQEAITNVLRHSEATEVNVSLSFKDDDIVLKIRDNGRGITPDQMMKPQSFGIIGIRERVRFWGGTSTFEGVPGNGTTVAISIPLKKTTHLSKSRA
jgi:two-component system, NarL family, sensor histidine kinase UhpB